MENIAIDKTKRKQLNRKFNRLKEKVKSGNIKIKENNESTVKTRKKIPNNRGVIYIGRIPHGFYENEMKSYFKQFGSVTRVKLARSKKTGRSKGFGFVEFLHSDVAKIAAEAMNNYLMYNSILKCQYIPPEEQKPRLMVRTISERNYPRLWNQAWEIKSKNEPKSEAKIQKSQSKGAKRIANFKNFFEEHGIDFNFKLNDPDAVVDKKCKSKEKFDDETESRVTKRPKRKAPVDDEVGILEIDESDDEIQFKTPPQVKKIIKKRKKKIQKKVK